MRATINSLWAHRYIGTLLLFICLLLVGIRVWALQAPQAHGFEPRIVNKTSSLQIVSSKKITLGQVDVLELILKNGSNKNITAIAFALGTDGVSTTIDYAFSEDLLTPGNTVVQNIPLSGLEAAAAKYSSPEADVTVSAVYFEDHTGDGDSKYLNKIREKYFGIKDQMRRILALLRKALESSSQQRTDPLAEIEAQASLLINEDDRTTLSSDFRKGLRQARQDLDFKIQRLKNKKDITGFRAV